MRTKLAAVKLLGGKCSQCGCDEVWVLEFHHTSGDKEFGLGDISNKKWEVVKTELLKCTLLCANCHRRAHTSRGDQLLLAELRTYNGRLLDF